MGALIDLGAFLPRFADAPLSADEFLRAERSMRAAFRSLTPLGPTRLFVCERLATGSLRGWALCDMAEAEFNAQVTVCQNLIASLAAAASAIPQATILTREVRGRGEGEGW